MEKTLSIWGLIDSWFLLKVSLDKKELLKLRADGQIVVKILNLKNFPFRNKGKLVAKVAKKDKIKKVAKKNKICKK